MRLLHKAGIAGIAAVLVLGGGVGAMVDRHQIDGTGRYAGPAVCRTGSIGDLPTEGQPDTVVVKYKVGEGYGGGSSEDRIDLHQPGAADHLKAWQYASNVTQVSYCWKESK